MPANNSKKRAREEDDKQITESEKPGDSEESEEKDSGEKIVIYAGRFQPIHPGHVQIYNQIKAQFPNSDVFVTTSNKMEERSPFSFTQKRDIMKAAGIPVCHIMQEINPYNPKNTVKRINNPNPIIIFAISEKDKDRFKITDDSYFQVYDKNKELDPKHGYIYFLPAVNFAVEGDTLCSATEIRKIIRTENNRVIRKLVKQLYPHGDVKNVFDILKNPDYKERPSKRLKR